MSKKIDINNISEFAGGFSTDPEWTAVMPITRPAIIKQREELRRDQRELEELREDGVNQERREGDRHKPVNTTRDTRSEERNPSRPKSYTGKTVTDGIVTVIMITTDV